MCHIAHISKVVSRLCLCCCRCKYCRQSTLAPGVSPIYSRFGRRPETFLSRQELQTLQTLQRKSMAGSNDMAQKSGGRSPKEVTFKLRTLSQVGERLKRNTEPQVHDEVTKRPWVFKAMSLLPASQPLDYSIPLGTSLRAP